MTRSGCVPRTTSTLGRIPSPSAGISLAESGQRSYFVRPMSREPAPRVKRISVVAGLSETMRVGATPIRTGSPKSSRTAAALRVDFSHAASASAEKRHNTNDRERKNKKRTLLPEECPQRARVTRRLTATRTSPEVLRKWRGRESSPGSGPRDSPSRLLLQSVALRVCVDARYSGGAAPASNRFPWLPFAINCWAKLSTSQRLRKRQNHRAADQ